MCIRDSDRVWATKRIARATLVGDASLTVICLDRSKANPQGMSGAGERHVEQPQVLPPPVAIGQGQFLRTKLQSQLALALFIGKIDEGCVPAILRSETGGIGQAHDRVFQTLALVDL